MTTLFANNASAPIASSITTSSTTITVSSGQGSEFPTITGTDYFIATLVDTSNNVEIVKVTARSADVMTVVRAQEGTTARAYAAGSLIELRMTAAVLTNFAQLAGDQTFSGVKTFNSTIVGNISGQSGSSLYAVTAANATNAANANNANNATNATNATTANALNTANDYQGTTFTATTQFSGPGTGLTGTAASLSIGGNAATATSSTTAGSATTAVAISSNGGLQNMTAYALGSICLAFTDTYYSSGYTVGSNYSLSGKPGSWRCLDTVQGVPIGHGYGCCAASYATYNSIFVRIA